MLVISLSLSKSHSVWWYSDLPYTHHSLSGGTQIIPILTTVSLVAQAVPILITVSLVVPRLSIYSLQSALWYSDYPYTHHSLTGCTQTIPILITVSLVILRLFLYSSQPPWWYLGYSYTHHSLSNDTQLFFYSSQSPRWLSDYPFTHHSVPGCTQTVPSLIIISLVGLRLSLHTSQSP